LNAVAFDLDDTLLHDDLTISDFTVRVLRTLRQKGFRIIAASGRSQFSMKPHIERLGCVSAYISCNGAEIWDGRTHALLRRELFSTELSLEIARFAEEKDCYAQVYDGPSFFFNKHCHWAELYASVSKLTGVYVGKLSEYIHEPRNKVLLIDAQERIASLYEEALSRFEGRASVTCSKPIYLEFNPLRATKGIALGVACGLLDTDLKETVAFGDSLNDLSMLEAAGMGIAVSNGWKVIFPSCDEICGTNNDDGPACWLNTHFLNGEVTA